MEIVEITRDEAEYITYWDSGFACVVKEDEVIEITNIPSDFVVALAEYVKKVGRIEIKIKKSENYGNFVIKRGNLRGLGNFLNFIRNEYYNTSEPSL